MKEREARGIMSKQPFCDTTISQFWERYTSSFTYVVARCGSVVRAFAHGTIGGPSLWTYWAISRSSQCSTTGITKAMVCYPLCGTMHIKKLLLLIGKSRPCGGSGFPLSLSEWSFTIICPTP